MPVAPNTSASMIVRTATPNAVYNIYNLGQNQMLAAATPIGVIGDNWNFAGPGAGFLLFGLVWWGTRHLDRAAMTPLLRSAIWDLYGINLFWGLLNLVPVWPLDGGQISRDVCQSIAPSGGLKFSLGLSLVTAGLLCLNSTMAMNDRQFLPLKTGSLWSVIFFGVFALQSFQLLQQVHAQERWTERHREQEDE